MLSAYSSEQIQTYTSEVSTLILQRHLTYDIQIIFCSLAEISQVFSRILLNFHQHLCQGIPLSDYYHVMQFLRSKTSVISLQKLMVCLYWFYKSLIEKILDGNTLKMETLSSKEKKANFPVVSRSGVHFGFSLQFFVHQIGPRSKITLSKNRA